MKPIRDQENIDTMRRRLYEPEADVTDFSRHDLSPHGDVSAAPTWDIKPNPLAPIPAPPDPRPDQFVDDQLTVLHPPVETTKKKYKYRSIILLVSLGAFLLTLLGTSLYLFFGQNQVSARNIDISISGPLSIGGGEIFPLEALVTNQNTVALVSAVMIVSFPSGTKSAEDPTRDIFEERITLDALAPGESITVPVRVVVFGEENQEREIRARIEYRLADSNGTFYKEAAPVLFTITSSPLVIQVDHPTRVAAGQEVEIKLRVRSNASNQLRDVLLSARYPENFDFISADPAPTYRQGEWLIKDLKPEQSQTITIRGKFSGSQSETFQMQFSAGTPRPDNQFILGSVLANTTADFTIERPFVTVDLSVNNLRGEVITAPAGQQTNVVVEVQNTLSETLYDMAIEVAVSGNVLSREQLVVTGGYYDSIKDVVRFEVSGDRTLGEVPPGATRRVRFTLTPNEQRQTPTFSVTANTFARRVSENRVSEQLIGTAKSEVRYTAAVELARSVERRGNDFGPVPPVVDTETTYTMVLSVGAGGNDLTGAVVTTSLPQSIDWKSVTSGDGAMSYNPVSKEITWTIGDIGADQIVTRSFQIGLRPSQNQVGQTPPLLGTIRLQATDKFTGAVVRREASPTSAELPGERDSGRVIRAVVESNNNE